MQMYSVSARNLYRISPWYRLKPLYLIFRKTDRTGQETVLVLAGVSSTIRPLSRMLAGPGLCGTTTDWLEQSSFHWGHRATVNSHHVRLQSSCTEQSGVRSIRKYSQLAVARNGIFSCTKVPLSDCWMCSSFSQLNVGVGQPTQLTPTRYKPSINYENRTFYTKLLEKLFVGLQIRNKNFLKQVDQQLLLYHKAWWWSFKELYITDITD